MAIPIDRNKLVQITPHLLFTALLIISTFLSFNHLSMETIPTYDESRNTYGDYLFLNSNESIFFPDNVYLKYRYYVKPPLKTWIKYPFYKVFGFSIFTSRFFDAFFGVLAVMIGFLIAARYFNHWIGFIAGIVVVTTDGYYTFWSRTNQYDSGFILMTILFLYVFLRYYEKLPGALLCGLFLGLSFYFKHIMMFLPFGLAGLYLLFYKGWKELFSKRFLSMASVSIFLPALWYVPFALKNPGFLNSFIKEEIVSRVFTGYSDNVIGPLFYINALKMFGDWIYLLPAALVIFTIYCLKREDRKYRLFLIWIYIPLGLLTLAKFKSVRYIYFIYPILGIAVGYMIYSLFIYIYSPEKKSSRNSAFIFLLIFTIFGVFQLGRYEVYTSSMHQSDIHIFANYFRSVPARRLFVSNLSLKDFERSEFLHVHFTQNRKFVKSIIHYKLLPRDGKKAVLCPRRDMLKMLFVERAKKDYLNSNFCYFNYSTLESFLANPPVEKVAVLRKDGELADYLSAHNIDLIPLADPAELIDYSINNNQEFVDTAGRLVFGYDIYPDIMHYYVDLLESNRITRKGIVKLFKCYATRHNRHFYLFALPEGLGYGMNAQHAYRVLKYEGYLKGLRILGVRYSDFHKADFCDFHEVLISSETINGDINSSRIVSLLTRLNSKDIILMNKTSLMKLKDEVSDGLALDIKYCDFRNKITSKVKIDKYVPLVFVMKTDNPAVQILSENGINLIDF